MKKHSQKNSRLRLFGCLTEIWVKAQVTTSFSVNPICDYWRCRHLKADWLSDMLQSPTPPTFEVVNKVLQRSREESRLYNQKRSEYNAKLDLIQELENKIKQIKATL